MKKPSKTNIESYSPNKPKLMKMMEESVGEIKMNKAYELKTLNNGSYIDGIPMLKWGEWKDNSYCGCITALLNTVGIPVSYEKVMGLSGVCWQAIMRDDWDPSSQMPQNGLLCEKNVGDALGINVYTIKDDKNVWEQAKNSIDKGIPVLLVGGRWAPEWNIACGYETLKDETKFFGRTYFDCQNYIDSHETVEHQSTSVPQNEIYTGNQYFSFNEFPGVCPGGLTRFYDRKCEPISHKQALKVSLETCIDMFENQPRQHEHKYGYDAYDVLISGFELDFVEYEEKCGNDHYHIGSMQDARRAAYMYLNSSIDLLEGENRIKLIKVSEIYKEMFDNLIEAVPYSETTPVFNDQSSFDSTTMSQRRQELLKALKLNRELEKQVRITIKDILVNWEK